MGFLSLVSDGIMPTLAILRSKIININQRNIRLSLIDSVDQTSMALSAHMKKLIGQQKTVGGYIPFALGQTKICIYNFFSVNYGFRSKGKVLICLTDKSFNPLHTQIFEIEHRQIFNLPFNVPMSAVEPVFCVVLLAHDHMRPNHGGHGGHLRFWGEWDNFSALSHSMPLPGSMWMKYPDLRSARPSGLADRRVYPEHANTVQHYGVHEGKVAINQRGDLSKKLRLNFGFSVIRNSDRRIASCFHNSPYTRQHIAAQSQSVEHVVSIPPVKDIEIYMYFGECCTLGSTFSVSLHTTIPSRHNGGQSTVLQEKLIEITSFDPIKLTTLFNNLSLGDDQTNAWLVFKSRYGHHRNYYINIVYGNHRTQAIFDGVHSHSFSPANKFHLARSLKFAPYSIGNYRHTNDECAVTFKSLLVVWGDESNSVDFRIRIYSGSNTNFEKVHQLRIDKREVQYIFLNDYTETSRHDTCEKFLVQLESEQQNLNANIFCLQLTEGKCLTALAVDHLTGG
jgi:hypothetical protein